MALHDFAVELFYSAGWQNHTSAVLNRSRIEITRGRGPESTDTPPAQATLTFNNRDDEFNPANPTSDLYGLVGRNTPSRISIDSDVRMAGEVASLQPVRNLGDDNYTDTVVSGVLRRLGKQDPLDDAFSRFVKVDGGAVGYWPLSEPQGSTQGQSGIGGPPMRFQNISPGSSSFLHRPKFGEGFLHPWLPVGMQTYAPGVVGASQGGAVSAPLAGAAGGFAVDFLYRAVPLDSEDDVPQEFGFTVDLADETWIGFGVSPFGAEDEFVLYDTGTEIDFAGVGGAMDGFAHTIRFEIFDASGNDVDYAVYLDGVVVFSGTHDFGAATIPATTRVRADWVSHIFVDRNQVGPLDISQVAVWGPSPPTAAEVYAASIGHAGEHTDQRFERLCAELGVTSTVVGTASDTPPMGPQYPHTALQLLQEIERTDSGFIFDTRTAVGLTMRTSRSLYNQTAALELTYGTSGHVAPPLDPIIDDQSTHNDVTATSPNDTSVQATLESGALSVQAPPDGVGRSPLPVDVNPLSDVQLGDHAQWWLLRGTVEGARYPQVILDMDRLAVSAPALLADVEAVDIGDLITIEDLEVDTVELVVVGYTETADSARRVITFNCVPADPYRIAEVEHATRGVLQSGSATTAEALDTTETGVDITAGAGPDWTHEDDFDITIGGERMTVTAVGAMAGTFPSRTCTLTVTRSVNGVVKSHATAATVAFFNPSYIGL